jgi:hypothetical protein
MKAPYHIEILSANGDVLHRHKVQTVPIRLGRGYDNDIILDDAHSGASHAIIDLDERGELLITDLGSHNGTIYRGKRIAQLVLGGNTVVRLGHTRMRVRAADFPVAPEVVDTTNHAWEGATPALIGLALIALFTGIENWIGDTEPFQLIRYLLVIASGLAVGLLWSGVWALANRLFGVHARLGRHLFILGCGLFAIGTWRVVANVMAYAWSAEILTRYGNLVSIALVCGMLFFHLRTIKPHHPRRFLTTCAVLMLAGSGLVLMTNLQSTGRAADELYMSVLLPPSLRHSPDHSVNDFLSAATNLKTRADAARSRSVKNGDDEGGEDDGD